MEKICFSFEMEKKKEEQYFYRDKVGLYLDKVGTGYMGGKTYLWLNEFRGVPPLSVGWGGPSLAPVCHASGIDLATVLIVATANHHPNPAMM